MYRLVALALLAVDPALALKNKRALATTLNARGRTSRWSNWEALATRGGAEIELGPVGTLTPKVGVYLWLAGGGLYALETLGISEPDFSLKYWGVASTPAMRNALEWMTLMIGWTTGLTWWALESGMDAVKLCQAGAVLWATGLALTLHGINSGKEKMTESPYILGAFMLLLGYLGYA